MNNKYNQYIAPVGRPGTGTMPRSDVQGAGRGDKSKCEHTNHAESNATRASDQQGTSNDFSIMQSYLPMHSCSKACATAPYARTALTAMVMGVLIDARYCSMGSFLNELAAHVLH